MYLQRYLRAITRELPDHYPFIVANEYIVAVIHKWHVPAENLFDAIQRSLLICVKTLVAKHFSKYSQGGLQQRVQYVLQIERHILSLTFTPLRLEWW